MKTPKAYLARDTDELKRFGQNARDQDSGRIVLAPVDFSEHPKAAIRHAARLAELVPSSLVALHVVHDPGDMPGYYSSLIKNKHFDRIQDAPTIAFHEFLQQVMGENPEDEALANVQPLMVSGI